MRAVFLSRDGLISERRADYVRRWEDFRFLPGVFAALRWLRLTGLHVFVVTNHAAVGRGIVSARAAEQINERMVHQITLHGGAIQEVRACVHTPEAGCSCRKPRPGMLFDLAAQWRIDLAHSYMIGDTWADMAAGRSAGCACVLVRPECDANAERYTRLPPDAAAADLTGAVEWVLAHQNQSLMATPPGALLERAVGAR